MSSDRLEVVVVGGGLAGLSAGLRLADAGAAVTLFEGRPRFGGATWSFLRNGLSFDNGQHVYLRCCLAYRRFLERLGTAGDAPLQDRLDIPVIAPGPAGSEPSTFSIRRGGLPVPLHLAPAIATYGHLSPGERLRLGRAILALRHLDLADPRLDGETFASFLRRHGQGDAAIDRLFNLIVLPTTNLRAEEVSLALAAKVFKTGLLEEADAADMGWANVPLARLHVEPALEMLRRAGARSVSRVSALTAEPGGDARLSGVLVDGERVAADAVVLAVGHEEAAELLAGPGEDTPAFSTLGYSPIVNVHVVYDRKVTSHRLAATVGSPAQFIFDRTPASGLGVEDGQCLSISVSGADIEHGERPGVLIDRYVSALADLFPPAREAKVLDALVTREHRATFRGVPGTAALRPPAVTRFSNLFLAGAWTDTGWPATMEGAVRSGNVAASLALMQAGDRRTVVKLPEEVMA